MKPARFEYYDPRSFEEAAELLQRADGDGKVMAGGQSLMPLMNMRLARPAVVVDINRIENSGYVKAWEGGVAFGATARQRSLDSDELVTSRLPIMQLAAGHIGHPQIRSRGTVCGSIAHADPAAELPALALALDAEIDAISTRGKRTIPAADFFVDYLTTSLEADEVVSEVRFPAPPEGMDWSFMEVSRRHGDFAMVGIVAGLALQGSAIADARLTYFGVGGTPVRCRDVEQSLRGQPAGEEAFAAAAAAVSRQLDPQDDLHATAAYRRSVAGVLTQRALTRARVLA
ncbi:MAG TPA: xanthine dehydrogenase family protein subunit M [Chloroflexota bacterium]|nr:xanthine dehydrogenase family protein subunit M [Chloroflexota bacterium]